MTDATPDLPAPIPAMTPREIVSELDRFIIGQDAAKRAVAVALRNRWRRLQLEPGLQEEIYPKNILMIGPTGVGKTEIARRLAKLAGAPFIKVEATKFTEVGYVGKDVESIVRDLTEIAIHMVREKLRKVVMAQADFAAEERLLTALVGEHASEATKSSYREKLRRGELATSEVEIDVADQGNAMPSFEVPGIPGASMSMLNITDMLGKALGGKTKRRKTTVADAYKLLLQDESDKLLDEEKVVAEGLRLAQQTGIVFIDEIDKISARSDGRGGDVSREGVQRDLLPLIEGTNVATKHGPVKTDHMLFIASGAFHYAKPSDLLAELQGRLPIRVELKALTQDDFRRILTDTHANLIVQYKALLGTENVDLSFDDSALGEIARVAFTVNETVENIGARRLHTVMEKLLEELSFTASEKGGQSVVITADDVRSHFDALIQNADLTRFIL